MMMVKMMKKRGVEDRGNFKLLSGDGSADDREDARTDDGPDAEGGQAEPTERFFQPNFWVFRIGEKLVDALTTKER